VVRVTAEIDVAGRLVQLGRGMVEQVSHQIFGQFAQCVRGTLEASAAPARSSVNAGTGSAVPGASTSAATAPGGAAPAPATPRPGVPLRALPLLWMALVATVITWLRRLRPTRRGGGGRSASPHQTGHP
jgi:hypothetical protein